ncbi:MAG: LarC family nickel insertion protein, partial [Kiritimatiellae bacterium]|nr:LarC family nickel insertion protein [Kiritimatiellia bacterium]
MKTLRFDSVGGASGDMILAALIDLGADITAIKDQLSALEIDNFDIPVQKTTYSGFRGTSLSVTVVDNIKPHHRHLSDILALIKGSSLPENVMTMSMKVFERLAEAEAEVHGTTPDKVHFHEVGAMDTIIDIVGSCIALDMLKIDSVQTGPLPLGRGTTECEHGTIPLPAPATLALLKDHPVIQTEEPFEMVTPT